MDFQTSESPMKKFFSIKIGDDFKVYGCGEYEPSDGVMYVKCRDESQLLEYFIRDWSADYPDIVTGWNSRFFDIPYLMNRIIRILGEKSAQKMSLGLVQNK